MTRAFVDPTESEVRKYPCPRCHAVPGHGCRTTGGFLRTPHRDRRRAAQWTPIPDRPGWVVHVDTGEELPVGAIGKSPWIRDIFCHPCRYCGAAPGEDCVTASGRRAVGGLHSDRGTTDVRALMEDDR